MSAKRYRLTLSVTATETEGDIRFESDLEVKALTRSADIRECQRLLLRAAIARLDREIDAE